MLYWKKETETALLDPPVNYAEPDGTVIINFHLNEPKLLEHGWTKWTSAQIAEWEAAHPAPVTIADYDNAMEAHLTAELAARGYTTRSPIEYTNSRNERWAQDARDWQDHLDEVMEYGLSVMNAYEAGEEVPTLAEFKEELPKIMWIVNLE